MPRQISLTLGVPDYKNLENDIIYVSHYKTWLRENIIMHAFSNEEFSHPPTLVEKSGEIYSVRFNLVNLNDDWFKFYKNIVGYLAESNNGFIETSELREILKKHYKGINKLTEPTNIETILSEYEVP